MGRIYVFQASGSKTAAGDVMEILAPSTATMVLHNITVTQSTEAGDTESEQVRFRIQRITGAPTSGSGGSSVTASVVHAGDAAASITCEAFNTTDLSGGTADTIWDEAVNVMPGWTYQPAPDERPEFSPSTYCLLRLVGSPADSITFQVSVTMEEIGG